MRGHGGGREGIRYVLSGPCGTQGRGRGGQSERPGGEQFAGGSGGGAVSLLRGAGMAAVAGGKRGAGRAAGAAAARSGARGPAPARGTDREIQIIPSVLPADWANMGQVRGGAARPRPYTTLPAPALPHPGGHPEASHRRLTFSGPVVRFAAPTPPNPDVAPRAPLPSARACASSRPARTWRRQAWTASSSTSWTGTLCPT